jgi:hypothetical protein
VILLGAVCADFRHQGSPYLIGERFTARALPRAA